MSNNEKDISWGTVWESSGDNNEEEDYSEESDSNNEEDNNSQQEAVLGDTEEGTVAELLRRSLQAREELLAPTVPPRQPEFQQPPRPSKSQSLTLFSDNTAAKIKVEPNMAGAGGQPIPPLPGGGHQPPQISVAGVK